MVWKNLKEWANIQTEVEPCDWQKMTALGSCLESLVQETLRPQPHLGFTWSGHQINQFPLLGFLFTSTKESSLILAIWEVKPLNSGMYLRSVESNSLRPYGLLPARLLCPWNFPGKNIGVSCYALLQENLLDPRIEFTSLVLLGLQVDSLPLHHWGSPTNGYYLEAKASGTEGLIILPQLKHPSQLDNLVTPLLHSFSLPKRHKY